MKNKKLLERAEASCEGTDEANRDLITDLMNEIDELEDALDSAESDRDAFEKEVEDLKEELEEESCEDHPIENMGIRFDFSKMTLAQQYQIEEFFNTQLQ